VFLLSLLILIGSAVGAGYAKDYKTHLAARMMLGFAAGQSEALVPMMIQVSYPDRVTLFVGLT
jgi:predicted MFS family arabinose efflux permease